MDPGGRLVGGRYRLLGHLGSGGMGTVWRADDTLLGREVAVKEVTFPPGTRPEEAEVLRERTRREARAAARLAHPNAVTVYDVVEEDGRPWLVMELVESRTLAQVVREGPLSPARTARVGLAVLGALEAAHRRGILHRDVKPSNVLLAPARDGQDERAVLTDFGIATSAQDSSLTSSGLLLGSPAYISPERAGGHAAGPASDLWSLGATLFTAVEGRPPFDGTDPLLTVTSVIAGQHAPYVLAGPLVPVLDGLLEKDPAARLGAAQARRLLREVADRASAAVAPAVAPTVPALAGSRSAPSTVALGLGDVQREVAHARQPGRVPVGLPARRGSGGGVSGGGVSGGGSSRRPGLPVAAGMLVVGLLAAGGIALTRGHSSPASAQPHPSPTAAPVPPVAVAAPTAAAAPARTASAPSPSAPPSSAAPSPSPVTAPPAAPPVGAVPAGWTTRTGPAGWAVALPAAYTTRPIVAGVEYRDPATGRTLRVTTGPGQADAVADRQRQARDFAAQHPDYQLIGITPVTYLGRPAADWEFTYAGLHVIDRVVVVGGTGHSLYFQTHAADAAAARADFDTVLATFRPAGL